MTRIVLFLLTSLVIGSQVFASADLANASVRVDKEQDTTSDSADGFILMRETFGNKEDLKVFNDNGNWAIEKEEDGNLVYCNKVKDSWTEFNFGENHWSNYSISYRLKFETQNQGQVETHIRKRQRRDYRTELKKHDDKVNVDLLGRNLVATVPANDWFNVQLSASGSEIETSINGGAPISVIDKKLQTGGGMIAVSANSKVCVDDIVVRQIGTSEKPANPNININPILDGHDYDAYQKQVASKIISNLGEKQRDLVIYDGSLFQPPKSLKKQLSDASLEYYYLIQDARPKTRPNEYYLIEPSADYTSFEFVSQSHEKIDKQMLHGTLFSFIYFADGKIVYDELPPKGRFNMSLNEQSHFASHSIGKSVTSYLLGHAICNGYIDSTDELVDDWPLMENTLYFGQPLIKLLNMSAGDSHVIAEFSGSFTKTGSGIHNQPLIVSVQKEGELKNTKPIKDAAYSYSNLTSDVLFNFVAHRVGEDFGTFLQNFYQRKIGIKHPVYLWLNRLEFGEIPSVKSLTSQGAWQYGISATRYDYLRIAKAILDDWKNDTCEGRYLKELYTKAVPTGKTNNWKQYSGNRYPTFGGVALRYAGQFQTGFFGLTNKKLLGMNGADGQQIIINFDDSRIIVMNAGQEGYYNTKSLAYDLIKSGKIKSGNWN